MKYAWILPSVLSVLLTGCMASIGSKSTSGGHGGDAQGGDSSAAASDEARELRNLERKLEVARTRQQKVELEQAAFEQELEGQIRHANAEVEMARARLALFRESSAPNRLASARLELQAAKDRAQEAADELAQIEIMYKDQDLDDLTAEFVVSRGRRSAARAAARIEIQEGELTALETRELPQEDKRLELELDKAIEKLGDAQREGEIGRLGQQIAATEARNEIARLEEELAAEREKVKS